MSTQDDEKVNSTMETLSISQDLVARALELGRAKNPPRISEATRLMIVIQGAIHRFPAEEGQEIVLGRKNGDDGVDLDLTPYDAKHNGVSRHHARLHIENGDLYITDLGSRNGTFLDGEQLPPNQPIKIERSYALLVMGSLTVQVSYHR
ncbi:MAG: FHA domain-containing protein [Chloroflexi bacterium]|nr:MAG: FHA domain-containing protein [Chloroflexota bacterium]